MNPIHLARLRKGTLMVWEIKKGIGWHGRAAGPFLLHCTKVQRRHHWYQGGVYKGGGQSMEIPKPLKEFVTVEFQPFKQNNGITGGKMQK